jgi:hypothetical protein
MEKENLGSLIKKNQSEVGHQKTLEPNIYISGRKKNEESVTSDWCSGQGPILKA